MNDNTIVKRGADGAIAVADPFKAGEYHLSADSIIHSMHQRQRERSAQFDALGDLAAKSAADVREFSALVKADDAALLDFEKRLRDALLDLSGFKAVVVQMRGAKTRIDPMSVRGKFAAILAECKARLEAEEPPKPRHTYCVRLTCDDDALSAVLKAAEKNGADGIAVASAQSDKAVKAIEKWFSENA